MKRTTLAAALTLLAAVTQVGCEVQTSGELGENQQLAQNCPTGQTVASYVAIDESATGRDDAIRETRITVIESIVRQVAVCSGRLHVVAFSSSAAASITAFDGALEPEGATEIARLRQVPGLVVGVMRDISHGLATAVESLPRDGSDITSQFGLAKEFIDQLNASGNEYQLNLHLMTDGVQTIGVVLNTPDLTVAVAQELGSTTPAPSLPPESIVKISGLGKTAGDPPPTVYIDALKAFFETYCQRTGASCEVVTDYTSGS